MQVSADDDRQLTVLDSWVKPGEHEHLQAEETRQSDESSRECIELSIGLCRFLFDVFCEAGAFVLSWDAVCELFDGIYLSWDPSAFQNQLVFHG